MKSRKLQGRWKSKSDRPRGSPWGGRGLYSGWSFALALALALATDSSAATIAYWTFDNTYADSVGGNTLVSTPGTQTFTTDVPGTALGSSTHSLTFGSGTPTPSATVALGAGDSGFDGLDGDYTLELFFKTTDADGWIMTTFDHTMFDGDPTGRGWAIIMSDGKVRFLNGDASAPSDSIDSTDSYNDGNWHHVAALLSSSHVMTLYVDGLLQTETATSVAAGEFRNGVRFGDSHALFEASLDFAFTGQVDEARISSGLLSPSQFLVPEPSTALLLGSGLLALAAHGRRRKA